MARRRGIGHLDADCFYVSAERVRDRFLVGKAVGVLGNQGACVIAKSYEMKAAGVRTGQPIWEARRLCPWGVYLKRDFRWYEVLSRRMLEVTRRWSAKVEYYSIDEFFFEVEWNDAETTVDDPATWAREWGRRLRDAIWEEVGVPVTVGIAPSRTLAKLLSDTAKPFGVAAAFAEAELEKVLARTAITEVSGIAGRRARRLAPWGVETCWDFVQLNRATVRRLLTCRGEALWWELRGQPVEPLQPRRPPHRAISRGGSLGAGGDDSAYLHGWLVRNLERLIEELEFHEVRAGRLTLWLGFRDGRWGQRTHVPIAPTDRFDWLLEGTAPLLEAILKAHPRGWANRMHLIAEELEPRGVVQLGLFDPPQVRARAETIADLKRRVNQRHGRFALRSGATLALGRELYHDPAHQYDICDVRGKFCF